MINSQGPAAGAFVGMGHVSGEHGRCASAHRTHGVADPAAKFCCSRACCCSSASDGPNSSDLDSPPSPSVSSQSDDPSTYAL